MAVYLLLMFGSFAVVLFKLVDGPSETVAQAHGAYWAAREAPGDGAAGDGAAGDGAFMVDAIVRYQRLEAYQMSPLVRARLADLLLRTGSFDEAHIVAEEALVADPGHPLALAVAAHAVDSLGDDAGPFLARFLEVYPGRAGDDGLARHTAELEALMEEARAGAGPGPSGSRP